HAERFWIAGELAEQRLVGGAGDACFGDEQSGGGRDDQRGDLRHQAVTDGEDRIGVRRVGKRQALLRDADNHAADNVYEHNQQPGDRVSTDEFGGAVHGAEETAFIFQFLPAATRLFFVDESG